MRTVFSNYSVNFNTILYFETSIRRLRGQVLQDSAFTYPEFESREIFWLDLFE